jgi:hypothetical protein
MMEAVGFSEMSIIYQRTRNTAINHLGGNLTFSISGGNLSDGFCEYGGEFRGCMTIQKCLSGLETPSIQLG